MNTNAYAPETKIILLCERCFQKLSVPKRSKKMTIRCPKCKYEFSYTYNRLGLSPHSKKYFLIGLIGSLIGFGLLEILRLAFINNINDPFTSSMLAFGAYGIGLGAIMSAGESFFRKDWQRMVYGLRTGALLGLISGVVSGLLAQFVYGLMLGSVPANSNPSLGMAIFARTVGWGILGTLMGGSYGLRENTQGDLKFGLLGGLLGGLVGGLLFDPLSMWITLGDGTLGRLVGLVVLGTAICVAVNHFREVAISHNNPAMYRTLSRRIPINPRMLSGGNSQSNNQY